jgi:hypothetical protein
MHASPVEAVLLMISETPWAVCAVESMGHLLEAVSLKISEAEGALCAVECIRHQWKQFR